MPDHDDSPSAGQVNGSQEMRSEQLHTESDVQTADRTTLARARIDVATVFDQILEKHWQNRNYAWCSRALAERFLGVDERVIRKWREGDKSAPLALLHVLPLELAKEISDGIFDRRVGGSSRGTILLAEALEQVALVVKGGYILDNDALDARLAHAAESIAVIRKELARRRR